MLDSPDNLSNVLKNREDSSVLEVCEGVRRRMLTLELRSVEPIDKTQVSEYFGVSRSPAREATNQLSAERLVVTLPNREAIVAPVDLTALPEFMIALDVQQRLTTSLAARNRSIADLDRLEMQSAECNVAVKGQMQTGSCKQSMSSNSRSQRLGAITTTRGNTKRFFWKRGEISTYISSIFSQYRAESSMKTNILTSLMRYAPAISKRQTWVAHLHILQIEDRILRTLRHMPDPKFQNKAPSEKAHD